MKDYYLPILLILLGILLFVLSIYFSIISAGYFVNLSATRDRAKRIISFDREKNKHIAVITILRDDLYYLNWYPKVILDARFKKHLKDKTCICVFTDSKGNIKKTTLSLSNNLTFKFGQPLLQGDNVVELYFEPDVDNNLKLVGNLIFTETSNVATPWIWFIKTILSILFFFIVLVFLVRRKHKKWCHSW